MSKKYPVMVIDGQLSVRTHGGDWISVPGYVESMKTWPLFARKIMADDGELFLSDVCHVDPPCGCQVVGIGTLQFPLTIEFCKTHEGVKV